jgi:hypothetical protein
MQCPRLDVKCKRAVSMTGKKGRGGQSRQFGVGYGVKGGYQPLCILCEHLSTRQLHPGSRTLVQHTSHGYPAAHHHCVLRHHLGRSSKTTFAISRICKLGSFGWAGDARMRNARLLGQRRGHLLIMFGPAPSPLAPLCVSAAAASLVPTDVIMHLGRTAPQMARGGPITAFPCGRN